MRIIDYDRRSLWHWLTNRSDEPVTAWDIIKWWENRRLAYNLIVGVYGTVCFVVFFVLIISSGTLKPGEDAAEPMGLIMAPFFINLLYTGGWILELACRAVGLKSRRFGPMLWTAGTIFSLVVCSIPPVIWFVACIVKIFHKL